MKVMKINRGFFVFFALVFAVFCQRGTAGDPVKSVPVFPAPQEIYYNSGEKSEFILDKDVTVVMRDSFSEDDRTGLKMLEKDTGLKFKIIEASSLTASMPEKLLVIGDESLLDLLKGKAFSAEAFDRILKIKTCPAEGYRLVADKNVIMVIGTDQAGTFYGMQTLRQLVKKDKTGNPSISKIAIRDYPDMRIRGQLSCSFNCNNRKFGFWEKISDNSMVMDYLASGKCNFYYIYLRKLSGENEEEFKNAADVFNELRQNHIEPVPIVTMDLHALEKDANCAEGIFLENKPFIFKHDLAVTVPGQAKCPTVNDPGFESVKENKFSEWKQEYPGDKTFVEQSVFKSGSSSLRLESDEQGYVRVWQDIDCDPDSWYEIQCDVKPELSGLSVVNVSVWGIGKGDDRWGNIPPAMKEWEKQLDAFPLGSFLVKGKDDWQRHKGKPFCSYNYKKIRLFLTLCGPGKAYLDNLKMESVQGKELSGIGNLILTETSPLVIKNSSGDKLTEGNDYELLPGETKYPFNDKNKRWQIKRLPEGKIQNGDKVSVSYNFARNGCHVPCPSEPRYYKLIKPLIQKVVKELNLKYYHMDYNEPNSSCSDSRCLSQNESAGKLLSKIVNNVYSYVKEVNPDCQLVMWSLDRWHATAGSGIESLYDNIPKDVIISAYVYQGNSSAIEKMLNLSTYFPQKGFRITGCPWFDYKNNYYWSKTIYKSPYKDKCLGVLSTNWTMPRGAGETGVAVAMEYSWTVNQPSENLFNEAAAMYEYVSACGISWMSPEASEIEKIFRQDGKEAVLALKGKADAYIKNVRSAYYPEFESLLDKHPMYRIGGMKKVIEYCDKVLGPSDPAAAKE